MEVFVDLNETNICRYTGDPPAVGELIWIDDGRVEPVKTTGYFVEDRIFSVAIPRFGKTWSRCSVIVRELHPAKPESTPCQSG